jgi:hypothetical protein
MMVAAKPIGEFVDRHPTVKMLALSFLVLVGVALVAEGTGQEVPKGYLYFAMAFSFMVEMLNLRLRKKSTQAVQLHRLYEEREVAPDPTPSGGPIGLSSGSAAESKIKAM